MTKYILCELNDENYSSPSFSFHNTLEEAKSSAVSAINNFFDDDEYTEITEEEPETADTGTRIVGDYDDEGFYVTEIFDIDPSKGTHLLMWHHAYNGVGFKIELQGSYEECAAELERQANQAAEDFGDTNPWIDEHEATVDTGNEWEHREIVEIE